MFGLKLEMLYARSNANPTVPWQKHETYCIIFSSYFLVSKENYRNMPNSKMKVKARVLILWQKSLAKLHLPQNYFFTQKPNMH